MDGTLYFQRPLQLHMGLWMLSACFRKGGFREMKIVLAFRRQRDKWPDAGTAIDQKLYELLAGQFSMKPQETEKIIKTWIYEKPLEILARYKDKTLIQAIWDLKMQNKLMAVYSDYPAEEKICVLGLPELPCFYGGSPEIGCLKPEPKGIFVIMQRFNIKSPQEVLMVGDRQSKDGQSALNAGVDYLILKKNILQRKKQYKEMKLK